MREGWEIKRLGEAYTFKNGINFDKTEKNGEGILTIDVFNMYGAGLKVNVDNLYRINKSVSDDYKLKDGDILIVRSSVKEEGVAWATFFREVDEPITFCGFIIRGRPLKELNSEFVVYYLRSHKVRKELIKKAVRSTITNINQAILSEVKIPIPPLSEQKRIVEVLDEAFSAIDKAKANVEKNLHNAKELFDSYLQSIFQNKSEGSEERRMADICTLINGRAYKQQELLSKGKYCVLRVGNFFTNKDWYYSDLELPDDKYCTNGDLLYAWSASFGPRIWEGEKVIYHYHIWKVIPNTELVTKDFLFLLLDWDKEQIKKVHGTGTTMMHVGKASMEQRVMPLPRLSDQNAIVSRVNAVLKETKKLEATYLQKLNDLEELKKSILQKAFAGELRADSSFKPSVATFAKVVGISATDLQAGIIAFALKKHQGEKTASTFGNVKAEKITNTAQYLLEIDLERNPYKDAAGPNDYGRLLIVQSRATKAGVFSVTKRGEGYSYYLNRQADTWIEKVKNALGSQWDELERLIDLFIPLNTDRAEVVATVYAAWNNLLIDGKEITDEAIVYEARENWHPAKMKIPREHFFKSIDWLRRNNLIPKGVGKKVTAKA